MHKFKKLPKKAEKIDFQPNDRILMENLVFIRSQ